MKNFFVSVTASVFILSTTTAQTPSLNDSIRAQLKEGIAGFQQRYHSPSIVVAIIHENEIIFSEALGYIDVAGKIPTTVESKYPVLSITKVFTATMYMQLMEKNVVTLDDDVRKYVPEYKGTPGNARESVITLLQLATHTSGLPRNSPADIKFAKQVDSWLLAGSSHAYITPATKKEFLESLQYIKKEYPDYQFLSYGDRLYSNLGYALLGIALERAAKKDFVTYIEQNIFRPLRMNNSGFDTEPAGKSILAKGYYYDESSKGFLETPTFKSQSAIPAGGMYSTATDLAKFISFQFENTSDTNKILSARNKAMMYSFRIGWKPSFPYVLHEGAMLGYRSVITFNPDAKLGWVILTNTTDFDFSRLNEYISKLVLPLYSKKPVTDLSKYVGKYKLGGNYDSLTIYIKEGKLYSTYLENSLSQAALTSSGYNKFNAQGKGDYNIGYEFIPDTNGEIKFLNLNQLMWIKQ